MTKANGKLLGHYDRDKYVQVFGMIIGLVGGAVVGSTPCSGFPRVISHMCAAAGAGLGYIWGKKTAAVMADRDCQKVSLDELGWG